MNLGRRKSYDVSRQEVTLTFERGEACIRVIAPRIINVFCGLESREHDSKAIEGEKWQPAQLTVEEREDGLWIEICP